MAELHLAAARLDLAGLDALAAGELVAFVGSDERPLRGLAGLIDFRLCGAITRQLKGGLLSGTAGERVLTVTAGRLPAPRVFLVGAGPAAALDDLGVARLLTEALAAVARAGGTAVATTPPGWGRLPAPLLARRAVDAAVAARLSRLVLLAPDAGEALGALEAAAEGRGGVRIAGAEAPSLRRAGAVLR